MTGLLRRHSRFLVAFAVGAGVGLGTQTLPFPEVYSLLAGVNAFFLLYIALMLRLASALSPAELSQHAEADDEGLPLIVVLAAVAVLASVTGIFLVTNDEASSLAARLTALVSLPLGWATIHVLAAFHYAHMHYRDKGTGMIFSGTGDPDAWDFLYASFTIGMTAQVSDVEVATRQMRRAVLVHGVASFFYNTCILALAVNAAVTAGR
jgi:uncharacterized membrane protein